MRTSSISSPELTLPASSTVQFADHLHQQAFDHSSQACIIFSVANGSIVSVNRSACKLFGYSKKDLLTRNRTDLFKTTDTGYKQWLKQRKKEGSAQADLSVIKKNGKSLTCAITSVEFNDDNDEMNSIMTIVDLSSRIIKQQKTDAAYEKTATETLAIAINESETRQLENEAWIKSVNKTTYDVIWDWDLANNMISFGKGYELVFGYKLAKNTIPFPEWISFFKPPEGIIVKRKIHTLFSSKKKSWKSTYQFTSPNGTIKQVISRANIVRDANGRPLRVIGMIHDQSQLQKLEDSHEQDIRIREKQLAEAIIEAKEMERSELGKELHDNVNQLLGASMLYLDMARAEPAEADIYLIHCAEYTTNAIAEIRQLTKGLMCDLLKNFGLGEAIGRLTRDIMETQTIQIHCLLDPVLEENMSEPFKLNTFRIIQEQLNNILKHAKAAAVHITLSSSVAGLMLSIGDDGIGFDTNKKSTGIGMANITSRAKLYQGTANFISEPGKGCMLVVNFPAKLPACIFQA